MEGLYNYFTALVVAGINPLKPYGTRLFEALMRLTIGIAFEAACVRRNYRTGKIELGLAKRSAKESYAPSEWHFPGSFYRPWETPKDVLNRLIKKEFGSFQFSQAVFVALYRPSKTDHDKERGHTCSELWFFLAAEFVGSSVQWFDHDKLPDSVHWRHQHFLIPWAIEAYERWELNGVEAVPKVDILNRG